ncbi:hypothetical protein AB4144_15915 [Rhizobiaceae sp. 2RAB30]
MQRLFARGGPWVVPWAQKVLPAIEELVLSRPRRTLFSRSIPAAAPGEAPGKSKFMSTPVLVVL